jgi:hypothetical protein
MSTAKFKREQPLQRMNQIQAMEYGSLKGEVRPKSTTGQNEQNGPSFKHQAWENGKNVSRRVPATQAPAWAAAIAGRQQFEKLAQEFVAVTVAQTRQPMTPVKKSRSANPPSQRAARPELSPAVCRSGPATRVAHRAGVSWVCGKRSIKRGARPCHNGSRMGVQRHACPDAGLV